MSEFEVRFVRHAKGTHMLRPELIAGRSLDASLTDEGWADAIQKGKELAKRGIEPDHIVSSSALRCIQTGQAILNGMKWDARIHGTDKLLEMDQGDFVGEVREEVYAKVQQQILKEGKNFALPGGESMNEVGKRGSDWLNATRRELTAQNKLSVLAIAHAGLITHTVGLIEGWDHPTSLKKLKMPTLAETRVVFRNNRWQLDYFGEPMK